MLKEPHPEVLLLMALILEQLLRQSGHYKVGSMASTSRTRIMSTTIEVTPMSKRERSLGTSSVDPRPSHPKNAISDVPRVRLLRAAPCRRSTRAQSRQHLIERISSIASEAVPKLGEST